MYIVNVLLTRNGERQWVKQSSHATAAEALSATSRLSQAYSYRMVGPDGVNHRLEWVNDPADDDGCVPVWIPE